MLLSRRNALKGAGLLSAAWAGQAASAAPQSAPPEGAFAFSGTYLDAAFSHPLPRAGFDAAQAYARARLLDPGAVGPRRNARNGATRNGNRRSNRFRARGRGGVATRSRRPRDDRCHARATELILG
jgi:hypothetical protein